MSAYLIYSKDPSLADLFLESQIEKIQPGQVLKYSFKRSNFKDIAGEIFNFSLFEGRRIYFLENVEELKDSQISFIARLDFNQLQDSYIFHLKSKIYWKLLPKWEKIQGLKIKELKLPSRVWIKNYLQRLISKEISGEGMNYIFQVYQRNYNFNEIMDALLKVSLYYPEAKEIDAKMLAEFLEIKEPPEINYLSQMLRQRDLKRGLETVYSLKGKGYKEEYIFRSLIVRLSKSASGEEAEFILDLEKLFKSGKSKPFFLLLKLLFYYSQPEVLSWV